MLRRLNRRRLAACDSFESAEEENEDDDDDTEYEDKSYEDAMTILGLPQKYQTLKIDINLKQVTQQTLTATVIPFKYHLNTII